MTGQPPPRPVTDTQAAAARAAVIAAERALGYEPVDRELEKLGYDIESRTPGSGRLRFIEVKGWVTGAETVTVTKNEILTSLNKPDNFILAIVDFLDNTDTVCYQPLFGDALWLEYQDLLGRPVLSEATSPAERLEVLAVLASRGRWVRVYYGWRRHGHRHA